MVLIFFFYLGARKATKRFVAYLGFVLAPWWLGKQEDVMMSRRMWPRVRTHALQEEAKQETVNDRTRVWFVAFFPNSLVF